MSTHVVNELHALPDSADDILNLLIEPGQPNAARMRSRQDDPTVLIGDTRCPTRLDYDNYLAWRTESGYTSQFEEMLAEPMTIR